MLQRRLHPKQLNLPGGQAPSRPAQDRHQLPRLWQRANPTWRLGRQMVKSDSWRMRVVLALLI